MSVVTYQPASYRKGLPGLLAAANRYLLGVATDLVDALEQLGGWMIDVAGGGRGGRRLALWGLGAMAFVILCGWAGWAVEMGR